MKKVEHDLIAIELEDLHLRSKRGYATPEQAEAEIKIIQAKMDLMDLAREVERGGTRCQSEKEN